MDGCLTAASPLPVRARNAAATRAAILAAAESRFAQEGYEGASLRDIAADVGVDAALISRYFGSKDELFGEVLSCGHDKDGLFSGDRDQFGERLARMLILDPQDDCKLDHLLVILRSVSSPRASEIIRKHGRETFYGPLEDWVGGDEAPVRSRVIGNIVMGFAIARAIDGTYSLDDAARQSLYEKLAALLQNAVN